MNAFTLIGMLTTGLVAVAALVAAGLLVAARVRGGDLRAYQVVDGLGDTDMPLGRAFTFRGARRIARRQRGTRIYNQYSMSYSIAAPGWSERANGFPGYHVSLRAAAEMLGIPADDGENVYRWGTVSRALDAANVRVEADRNGQVEYNTADVIRLARERASVA